jgi:hypothetical protein
MEGHLRRIGNSMLLGAALAGSAGGCCEIVSETPTGLRMETEGPNNLTTEIICEETNERMQTIIEGSDGNNVLVEGNYSGPAKVLARMRTNQTTQVPCDKRSGGEKSVRVKMTQYFD